MPYRNDSYNHGRHRGRPPGPHGHRPWPPGPFPPPWPPGPYPPPGHYPPPPPPPGPPGRPWLWY